MESLSRRRWRQAGIRALVYGVLAGTIYYLQPVPRCYFNIFREANLVGPCVEAGDRILLRARYRAYALVLAADKLKAAGQLPEAVVASERAFALDPLMQGGNYQVVEMLTASGRHQRAIKNYANALGHFSRALDYAPDQPILLIERAQTHLEIAAFDLAFADFDRVIALRPADGTAYRRRALAKWQALHDPAGALLDFEKAITLGDKRSMDLRAQLINMK